MEKEFVPYELAVKLKQIGFNELCLSCYNKLGMIASHGQYVFDYKNYNSSVSMVSRPTFSQAFRWFREKHDLQYWLSDGGMLGKSFVKITGFKQDKFYFSSSEPMEYEEAELACLTKLIEIVESKSE